MKIVHLASWSPRRVALCPVQASNAVTTNDPSEVTCKACLKSIARNKWADIDPTGV